MNQNKTKNMIFSVTRGKLICFLLALTVTLYFIVRPQCVVNDANDSDTVSGAGAVVSFGKECADIGKNILKKHKGSAADAAIAVLFCEGVTCPQSTGLGGGFGMTIYNRATKTVETLIARERAPKAAHKDMFGNATTITGILSVAVPGELKGYWELHQKYGRVPWKTLVEPSIELCKKGFVVLSDLSKYLQVARETIVNSESLREMFVNPKTQDVYLHGDRIRRPDLAQTLEIIAKEGADAFYSRNGSLLRPFVEEIQQLGGIITEEDFLDYEVEWAEPISALLPNERKLYTVSVPASGSILTYILNIMKEQIPEDTAAYLHRMIETFKFAYAKRTQLGDGETHPDLLKNLTSVEFARDVIALIKPNETSSDLKYYGAEYANVEDHGTTHISVLASNGDAISVTATINSEFGYDIRSRTTGIILNDEMDDFSTNVTNAYGFRPSPANFVKPGKRPLSSMCPSIILDKNDDVVMVVGAAGGARITSSVASVIINHLFLNNTLYDAIHRRRIHHQLLPMHVFYEKHFDQKTIDALVSFGHKIAKENEELRTSAITAISRVGDEIEALPDTRREGSVAIF